MHGDVLEAGLEQRRLDVVDPMVSERDRVEDRRILPEKASDSVLGDPGERIEGKRVPDIEMVGPAAHEHTMDLAIGLGPVREEHDAELAGHGIELFVPERKRGRIRAPELDFFTAREFLPGDVQHRRIEIAGDQLGRARQGIAQEPRDDAGAGRELQDAARFASGGASRQVGRVVDEQMRAQPAIVVGRDAAGEACGLIGHDR
jgi:hypothetical protein